MKELFEFLNQQSGNRLAFYGVIFLCSVYFIMQGLVYMCQAIFKKSK